MFDFLNDTSILLIGLVLVLILLIVLVIVQFRNNAAIHHLTYPVYDYTVKAAQQRAGEITLKAEETARTLVADAERQAAAILVERGKDSERAVFVYEKALADLLEKHKQMLASYVSKAESVFQALPHALDQEVAKSKEVMATQWGVLARKAEEMQISLGEEVKKQIAQELGKEMESIKSALASYRRERMALVEKDIMNILEKTTALVIRRRLSLKDRAGLVLESFEEAQREGVFK